MQNINHLRVITHISICALNCLVILRIQITILIIWARVKVFFIYVHIWQKKYGLPANVYKKSWKKLKKNFHTHIGSLGEKKIMKISKLKKTIVKKIGLIYYHTHDLSSMSSLSLASWFQGCPKGMDPPSRRRVFILSVLGLRMTSSAAHRMQIARFTLSRVEGEANASASMVKRTPTLFTEPALMA